MRDSYFQLVVSILGFAKKKKKLFWVVVLISFGLDLVFVLGRDFLVFDFDFLFVE